MVNIVEVQVSDSWDWGFALFAEECWIYCSDELDLTEPMIGRSTIDGVSRCGCGHRFRNITIPKGATITKAYISVKCYMTFSPQHLDVKSIIAGEKDVNSLQFTPNFEDYCMRRGLEGGEDKRTSVKINWNITELWEGGQWYNSPEMKAIIQEIVNLSDWESGNPITIFWDDHDDNSGIGQNYREIRSYNTVGSPSDAPILHIEWEETPIPSIPTNPITAIVDAMVSVFSTLYVVLADNAETLARLFLYGLVIAGFVKSIRKTYGGFRGLIQWG